MIRIGLTGGIASGKSTVAERFKQHGIAVSSADQFARDVVEPGSEGLAAVVEHFGPAVLNDAGELNRKALRERVFNSPPERQALETILHPRIRAATASWCEQHAARGEQFVVLEIPLLLETQQHATMDRVLVVDVPEATQLARVQARDHSTAEQAQRILAAQASRAERLQAATDILLNDRTLTDFHNDIDALAATYQSLYS